MSAPVLKQLTICFIREGIEYVVHYGRHSQYNARCCTLMGVAEITP
jgi:hypothetical protein